MRAAYQTCEEPELSRLAPRSRAGKPDDPLALHETIAYDWMAQGGKRSRPFITLAAYDALKGGLGTLAADTVDDGLGAASELRDHFEIGKRPRRSPKDRGQRALPFA